MTPLAISLVAFACICGGILLGMFLRTVLPDHHLNPESKDVWKLGIGMTATLAALVLGLLFASAKGSFDTTSSGLRQVAAHIILLDRFMAHYGPETIEGREMLRRAVACSIVRIWPEEKIGLAVARACEGKVDIEAVQHELRQLVPRTDAERWLQSRAYQISGDIAEGRWLFSEQLGETSTPMPFFVMLVFWLTIIFASFGLFSPRNPTVIIVLLVCALSVVGALFLILDLANPLGGMIKVSSAPLCNALAQLGQVVPGPLP